ncbi:alpha/beta hydrolase [Pigmentiphaga aceris]|uniref:Alpha/beta hydrolase n=2 Tax=Pigmentiphaga aceris TaxID=1940612 RepID=A0A5C0B4T8_9BURK|nr:alpha/beta hydrolase [Pigmentiphaga aceris]
MTVALLAALVAGCAAPPPKVAPPMIAERITPLGQSSFDAYLRETTDWVTRQRNFQTADHASELAWNAPREWRPAAAPRAGVLLVHGLGDSPWSFSDIGEDLAARGYLVRSVLLPGHGTKPADLIDVRLADWQRLVREQVALMRQDVPQVYLGGFSTGANLVAEYALDDEQVRGLLLFSPAFKSNVSFDWFSPLLAHVKTWLREPSVANVQQTPQRYLNVPTNGFAQFYRGSVTVRDKMASKAYDKPTLVVVSQHDSVVDVGYVLKTFQQRFTHSASRMIWYGALPAADATPRVLTRSDRIPEANISEFSHMGVLFSPRNPVYGSAGTQRLCWNGQDSADLDACLAGAPVWYSDWGYREAGKVHARLTFNPYFDWQASVMAAVMEQSDGAGNASQ